MHVERIGRHAGLTYDRPAEVSRLIAKVTGTPGAFILLGCMVATKNWLEARQASRQKENVPLPVSSGGCH